MPTSPSRIAAKFIQAADGVDEAEVPEVIREDVTQGMFIDLIAFFLAVDSYRKMRGEDDPHLKKVVPYITRYQDEVVAGFQKFFLPLLEQPSFIRLKSKARMAVRPVRGLAQAALQAEAASEFLQALHAKATLFRETLSDHRAHVAAMKVAALVGNEAPETILNGLAVVPPASRLSVTRKWVREAASVAGVAPTEIESTIADAAAATDIGADIHHVEVALASVDPVSEEAAELQGKKRDLLDRVSAVAGASPSPAVVVAAATTTAARPVDYATAIGRKQHLSPDQEQAMLVRGKGIIAAGAGSGKTRVLSSKVAYHVNELGLPASAVLATSFSRKSAAELRQKIEKCGVDIPIAADAGFGTTHSIASKLMKEYGSGSVRGEFLKPYETSSLIRIAMAQVQMTANPLPPPPTPTSLFADLLPGGGGDPEVEPPVVSGLSFKEACQLAYDRRGSIRSGFLQSFITALFNPNDPWYRKNMAATRGLVDPRGFSEKQQDIIIQVFQLTGVDYHPSSDPVLNGTRKTAAKDKNKSLRERYPTFTRPAGQWFNLGHKLEEEGPDGVKKPIPPGVFSRAITKWKGRAVSPSEAWAEGGTDEAAVYAAYEFLKGPSGETDFVNKGDFDDVLLDASKMLLSNPRALQQVQSRFKLVLCDEAQDLNRCVSGDTKVETPDGPLPVRDVSVGTKVLSFENGQVVYNRVLNKERSSWGRGYRIHLASGETLLMSPNHRIYATPLGVCPDGQLALYLMYRKGMGFRIGTTTRLFQARETSVGRGVQEHANCAWILEVGDPEDILYKEQALSLKYAIPTYIFEGTVRGCDQSRIDRIFQEFGENGKVLLEKYDLDFRYPHWVANAVDRGRFTRRVVNFCPHRGKGGLRVQRGSSVNMNWTDGDFDLDVPVYNTKWGRKMVGVLTIDYAEGRRIAQHVAEKADAHLLETLWVGSEKLPLITASGLLPGMRVPVWSGGVDAHTRDTLSFEKYKDLAQQFSVSIERVDGRSHAGKRDLHQRIREAQLGCGYPDVLPPIIESDGGMHLIEIEAVEVIEGGDYWDIAVENAHNFFGNGILSHNSQHLLFGLVAGYVDPTKAAGIGHAKKMSEIAKPDSSITADTYCLIGDDFQAIYEFRSADPEAFIDMSDLVEGGAGFQTKILKTNYRSGKNIVEAANRLIGHNKKQVPKVCEANPTRADQGGIERVPFNPVDGNNMDAPAEWLAERIAEDHEQGLSGSSGYDSYGIGLRSNAEAYTYGLALLEKGIPFRSKANFFKDPSAKALICWLTIADEGLDGNVDRINEAVLGARTAPATMLGDKFVEKVTKMATGNYLVWLQTNWSQVYGSFGDWSAKVEGYTKNLVHVASLKGKPAEAVLTEVLALTGFDGQSVLDALVNKIEGDEDRLEELRKESTDGKVTPEALAEAALAPVKPLKKLLGARADLTEAMKYVRQLQQANESLATEDDPEAKGFKEPAVTLGTMHSWKGLEVPTMFVPVVGGRFPRSDADEDALASERRLAYVALTRGENQVYVLDIPTMTKGRRGVPPQVVRSRFFDEMCIPTRGAPSKGTVGDEDDEMREMEALGVRVAGVSPWDEDEIEAYLRGERP